MNKLDDWRKHAIEVMVIVGSILLAFAIDAAWDSRKDSIQEQQLLTFISADMERNINAINGVIGKNLERDKGLYNFMSSTPESLSHLTLSTSRDFFADFHTRPWRIVRSIHIHSLSRFTGRFRFV